MLDILSTDIADIAEGLGAEARDLSGRRLLITGARGFIGRYFCAVVAHLNDKVLDEPCRVVALDNLIAGGKRRPPPLERPDFEFVDHDVIRPYEPADKVDNVIHAAGIASPFYYRAFPLETLEVATTGTRNLLELARKHDARILFMSSSEIYGDPDPRHVPTPESYRGNVACQGPRACYDEGKRVGETLCHIFHERFGTRINTVRPFNVYGPGMLKDDYRVLPNFASRIVAGDRLKVYGTGAQTRTYCYVTDAVTGFFKALLKGVPGEVYNIGCTGPEVSVLDLVRAIERVLGRSVAYDVIEHPDSYPADEPLRRCPDIRKATLQLGYAPRIGLEEGLGRFLTWASDAYTAGGGTADAGR